MRSLSLPLPSSQVLAVKYSLSIVVPVRDREAILTKSIQELLEIIADLTHHFELLIIDDGSTDETGTIAAQLSRHFPQVRLIRHALPYGKTMVTQAALRQTTAPIVMIVDRLEAVSSQELRELWKMRGDQQLVMVRPQGNLELRRGTTRMLRRPAIEKLARVPHPEEFLQVHTTHPEHVRREGEYARPPRYLVRLKSTNQPR